MTIDIRLVLYQKIDSKNNIEYYAHLCEEQTNKPVQSHRAKSIEELAEEVFMRGVIPIQSSKQIGTLSEIQIKTRSYKARVPVSIKEIKEFYRVYTETSKTYRERMNVSA